MRSRTLLLATLSFWLCTSVVVAEVLANSGYPMLGANPERNYKIDRSVLCPQIAPGRTTVLSVDWYFPPQNFADSFSITSRQLTLDESGNLYVVGQLADATFTIFKVNALDGSFNPLDTGYTLPTSTDADAHPTHVKNNKFYLAPDGLSVIVDSSTMTSIAETENPTVSAINSPSSFVPYGTSLMVKSNTGADVGNSMVYIDALGNIDTNAPNTRVGYEVLPVMVWTTQAGTTPVVISPGANPSNVYTADWSRTFPGNARKAWIDGDSLFYLSNYPSSAVVRVNLTNNVDVVNTDISTFNGNSYSWDFTSMWAVYHNDVLFTQISQDGKNPFVDLMSGKVVLQPSPEPTLIAQPLYLKKDNMVLNFVQYLDTGSLQVRGLEWGTWKTKMVAQFNGTYGNEDVGLPIVGEDCRMYTVVTDRVYSFAPLPIQDVVPILQCVDLTTNEAYFSYKYLGSGSKDFVIPHVSDRNELTPEGVAPWTDFTAGEGPLYPLSYKVVLNTSAATHTWVLEDYTLTFAVGSSLACPTTANIVIRLSANGLFPVGFEETVRSKFVFVTGITDSRVTIVPQKRSLTQSNTLETELQVAPDPNGNEPSPAEVVQNFVSDNNQQKVFSSGLVGADGSPAGLKVDEIVGQKTGTEVEGVLPPQAPPTSPVSPPAAPIPTPISVQSPASLIPGSVRLRRYYILQLLVRCSTVLDPVAWIER